MHVIGTSDRPDWPLAVVIGAGGMSLVIARRLSQRHRILIADIDEARAEAGAQTLRTEGGDAKAVRCDITDAESVKALAEAAANHGGVRTLAHVAGLSPSLGDFSAIIRVNLRGMALVAEALLPLMSPGGAAVMIASAAAHGTNYPEDIVAALRDPTHPDLVKRLAAAVGEAQATSQRAYGLSKYGLRIYCRRAAGVWAERGARIVSLSPGLIASPQGAREFAQNADKMRYYNLTPMKREGTMLEIADAVEFLVSDRASFITGTDLIVDGGLNGAIF